MDDLSLNLRVHGNLVPVNKWTDVGKLHKIIKLDLLIYFLNMKKHARV